MYKPTIIAVVAAAGTVAFASASDGVIKATVGTESPRQVTVTALTDNIIKVSNLPAGTKDPESRTTVLGTESHAEVKKVSAGNADVMVTSSGVVATLDRHSGAVTISAGPGRMIADNGIRSVREGRQTMHLTTSGDGSFYGAGERGHSLNIAGDTLRMYNRATYGYGAGDSRIDQMNITMPLAISSNGYAILFDDYATAEMILSNPLEYISESDEPVSYYFINGGGTVEGTVNRLSSLTGRQQLPPIWSLGYITSRYGYRTEKEALGAADSLKRAGYPLDGLVLDLYWFGREQDMGRLDWDTEAFPKYKEMLSKLKRQGINTVIISEPFVLRNGLGIDNFNELSERRMFVNDSTGNTGKVTIWVGDGGMFDVSNPQTRQWLADRYKKLTDDGVEGWWGDLGEPEAHPDTLVHYNGKGARQYHNLYGNDWAGIIADLFRGQYPQRRLMTLMRGGTVGLQRHNVFPWSGDVSRSWPGMQAQVTIMLNSGLSGLGYMSHDVGGFAIDPANPIDPELYVRWLQLGLFTPTLRTHAQQFAEPYHYPDQQDIILPLIKERYAWLPYNYTLAYQNAANGDPFVRPLNYYDRSSSKYDDIDDQYLWGRDVMVAPVMEKGAVSRRVVFPSGRWLDMNDPSQIFEAGDTITCAAPIEVVPVFVRAGAFIPRADYEMDNTGDYKTSKYTVRFYPVGGHSNGMIYEDDMTTPTTLDDGRFTILKFDADTSEHEISIVMTAQNGSADYSNPSQTKTITFEVYNIGTKPTAVTFDGKKTSFRYDAAKRNLKVTVKWDAATESRLLITK